MTTKKARHTTAVAYMRVSTDKQDETCDAQRAAILKAAARRRVTVVGWYADSNVKGESPQHRRPEFQKALDELKKSGATLLFVAKPDRLSRGSAALFEQIQYAIRRSGAEIAYADGTPEENSATATFQRDIMFAVAKLERGFIAERTAAALQAKKARGERVGRVPYGFRSENGKLVPCELERAVLERIKLLHARGVSLRDISARVPPLRNSKAWHPSTLSALLKRDEHV